MAHERKSATAEIDGHETTLSTSLQKKVSAQIGPAATMARKIHALDAQLSEEASKARDEFDEGRGVEAGGLKVIGQLFRAYQLVLPERQPGDAGARAGDTLALRKQIESAYTLPGKEKPITACARDTKVARGLHDSPRFAALIAEHSDSNQVVHKVLEALKTSNDKPVQSRAALRRWLREDRTFDDLAAELAADQAKAFRDLAASRGMDLWDAQPLAFWADAVDALTASDAASDATPEPDLEALLIEEAA